MAPAVKVVMRLIRGKPVAMASAMATQVPILWHHAVAIAGQAFFTILLLRIGVILFKRNVMKSGSGGKNEGTKKRKLFGLIPLSR